MSAASQRQTQRSSAVVAPGVGDLVGMYVKRNPRTPRTVAETAGRLTAALGAAAARLSVEQQRELVAHKEKIPEFFAAMLANLEVRTRSKNDDPAGLSIEEGDGLGEQLDAAEGRRRLQAYATPIKIEDWAGEVAGSSELEREYGIRRSTLHDWQKQNAVVGLLAGLRKHVFPVTQFVDGRPVAGLADVVSQAGSPRTAWLWLIEQHPSLGACAPLDRLKAGEVSTVLDLAERDFGQS